MCQFNHDYYLQVLSATDPSPMDRRDVYTAGEVLSTPDPAAQQATVYEATPDVMLGEQTWPTADEMVCDHFHFNCIMTGLYTYIALFSF